MLIPSQNEFLLPLLRILSDGQVYTRAQMMFRLAKHFNISEQEAQQMSGNQFTLVSRIAWCDVHFVKAGFVEKHQQHADSMQDTFRITTLGIRELNKRPERITVGYLQGFYLGKVHRGAGSDDTTSDAELLLYEAFENLPDAFTVLHSVKWIAHQNSRLTTVGEIDFLIAHRDLGVLIMEVKGGRIQVDRGHWYSGKHEIKDPCEQAERNRRALSDWLSDDPRTRGIPFALFPAVALPDSQVAGHIRPDCPQDIFIDVTHLHDLESRLMQIFRYWKAHADSKNSKWGGQRAVDALVNLLVPTRSLQPKITEQFARENRKIEELTQQQFRILKMLRYQRRAAVIGGAGTGKTLLAIEKATQLAESGMRVLFVCYNANLADWIKQRLQHPQIDVFTFHALVGHMIHRARIPRPRGTSFYDQVADLLVDAAGVLHAPDADPDMLYDAIVVDEGQDFEDTWWIGLLETLKDPEHGIFYVFFDDNQRIFTQISQIPMDGAPLYLDENLRNTQHIHERLKPYSRDVEIQCIGPEGRPVEVITAADKNAERRELQRVLHRLVNEEGIPAEHIVVLTPAGEKRSQWKSDDQLGNFILTWQLDTEMQMAARVCTIYSYKGLESPVVILTELHALRAEIADQLLYVGLSRARHHAIVIGELPVTVTQT